MKRLLRPEFLLLVAMIAAAPADAAPTASQDWTLQTLMSGLSQTRNGEARFVETKTLGSLKEPLVTSGVLRYRHPDSMEKEIEKPRAERFVIAGDSMETWRGGKRTRQVSLAGYPALRNFVTSFIATVGGDLATLQKFYRLTLSGNQRAWTLIMIPTDPELKRVTSLIEVRGSGTVIDRFETIQPNNDRSVMRITPLG